MWELYLLPKVEKWLSKLTKSHRDHVVELLSMLEQFGNELTMPTVRNLGKGLYELRDLDFGYRVYFCYDGKHIIVSVLGGDKSSQSKDINKASKLIKDIKHKKIIYR